ncbi:hypothetical protein BHM03_00046273 [Ensete ventricosum]|nr:hypothetical protein BHM03_00046273 [Ensete ventricosum]
MELQLEYGSRSSLGISGSDDTVEPRREFARRFVEGIRKLVGNTLVDHQKKTIGLVARMPKAAGLGGNPGPLSPTITISATHRFLHENSNDSTVTRLYALLPYAKAF